MKIFKGVLKSAFFITWVIAFVFTCYINIVFLYYLHQINSYQAEALQRNKEAKYSEADKLLKKADSLQAQLRLLTFGI